LLEDTNRLGEAEPLMRRALALAVDFHRRTGHQDPSLNLRTENYRQLLATLGRSETEIDAAVRQVLDGTPAQ